MAFELRGVWYPLQGNQPIEFGLIEGQYRTSTKEVFYVPHGHRSYSIEQYVRLTKTGEMTYKGLVTFYDSRGCTFKDLPVSAEAESDDSIAFLLTVPRYKFRTITKASTGEVLRTECKVLEYVEVPTKLYRY